MLFYFYRNTNKTSLAKFHKFAIEQNALVAKNFAFLILGIIASFFIARLFVDYHRVVSNPQDYKAPFFLLIISSLSYIILLAQLNKPRFANDVFKKRALSMANALIFIIGSMWITFIAQRNPGNTMTMFLLGVFAVSILWIFMLKEAIAIALSTFAIFIFGLRLFQTNNHLLWQNSLLGCVVIITFFFISRVLYAYHFNYFLQLKTIEEKNKEINNINKIKTDILGVVAHDLRSPLNNILSLVDLINHPATDELERKEYINFILTACYNAEHIINDLIETAKENEPDTIEKQQISLNNFLQSVSDQWKHRMPENRQLISNLPDKEIVAFIHEKKMNRVFDNLISNAIKFTPDDGIIQIDLQHEADEIKISISDNGVGIPNDLQPYLFDRFSKAGRKGLNGEKSYGLGLSICQQIIEQHGGTITVISEPGNGTTFYISLSLEKAN